MKVGLDFDAVSVKARLLTKGHPLVGNVTTGIQIRIIIIGLGCRVKEATDKTSIGQDK
jgi:hypothetical protein